MVFSTSFNIIYFIQLSLYLLLCFSCITSTPSLPRLVTTGLFSVSLLLFCYIQSCDLFFRLRNTEHHTVLSFSIWPISFSLTPWIPSTLLQMAKVPCFMVGLSSTVSVCGYRHSVCVWVYTQRHLYIHTVASLGFPEGTSGREPTCKCKRWVTVQSLSQEDPLEKEAATHFSVQCLENSTNRGAWWAAVHGVTRVGHA